MLSFDLHNLLTGFLKLALLAGAALYSGLVIMNYRTDHPHFRWRLDWHDPAHAVERLTLWPGIMALALAVGAAAKLFATLSEASADVGEWVLDRRRRESH